MNEREWLGDYLVSMMDVPGYTPPAPALPQQQMPVPEIERVEQPPPMPQRGQIQPPNISGSLTVPLPMGEMFARGMFAPQDPRPLQGWNFGYRMRF